MLGIHNLHIRVFSFNTLKCKNDYIVSKKRIKSLCLDSSNDLHTLPPSAIRE